MKKCVLICAFTGIVGAALFYRSYIPGTLASFACPVCPYVSTNWGTPIHRSIRFILLFGLVNAVLFSAIGALTFAIVKKLTRKQTVRMNGSHSAHNDR